MSFADIANANGRCPRQEINGRSQHPAIQRTANPDPRRHGWREKMSFHTLMMLTPGNALGGLLAVAGAVIAQAPDPLVGAAAPHDNSIGILGVLTGITGVLTLIGNMARSEFQERRTHELKRLQITAKIAHNRDVCALQQTWIVDAVKAMPGLPAPPVLPAEPETHV
jgi:hypothetical protein